MIDCHVITLAGERADWLAAALASLQAEGVAPRIVESIGDAGVSRINALRGVPASATYVTWCDHDDIVLSGAFAAIKKAMLDAPGAGLYFTDEEYMGEAGRVIGPQMRNRVVTPEAIAAHPLCAHHLVVIRADLLPRLLAVAGGRACGVDWVLTAGAARLAGCVRVPVVGYRWRIRPGSASVSAGRDVWTAAQVAAVCAAL